jgi:radical SAM protein with 4Fe4S-binding SPASM domain
MKNLELTYVLNPEYALYPDEHRIILTNKDKDSGRPFSVFLHPMLAVLLTFFKGNKELAAIIAEVSSFFSITKDAAYSKVEPFIENNKDIWISYDGCNFSFPRQVLIKNNTGEIRNDLDMEDMLIMPPYDLKSKRLYIPKSILLVLNTQCVTDCVYCYADRKTKYIPMPLKRILELIDEAVALRVSGFDLSGGEVFAYKNWETVLKKLLDCGFDPYVSTKFPISKDIIDRAYDAGLRTIQISLDSIDPVLLKDNLNVSLDYSDRIKQTIALLDEKGIKITLKSTVTKHTCTVENISRVMDFAIHFKNIEYYTFTPTGYTHYKSVDHFNQVKPTIEQTEKVIQFLNEEETSLPFSVKIDNGAVSDGSECCNYTAFKGRSLCTGNIDGVIVLPDGKVTICEELYWNERFIIGDLMNMTLQEVWSSDQANNLWKLNQDRFPPDSECRTCQDFENCRYGLGVCWKEIIAVYGRENWLYPDPRCPKAPKPIYPVYYDNSFMEK